MSTECIYPHNKISTVQIYYASDNYNSHPHSYHPTSDTHTAMQSKNSKVVPHSITSVSHGADPGFLAVSLQVTLVINPVVGCYYFPPGPRLLSQPKRSRPLASTVPNYTAWWQRHTG